MARKRYFYLTPVLGGPGAPRYPVTEEPQLVGRSERAAIALLEPTVSREHAAVQTRDSQVYLEDLGSKHGTFVNSKRVTTVKLKVGDIIVFGLSLVLRLEETDRPIPRAPTLDGPATETTVSSVEPLPAAGRQDETRVAAVPEEESDPKRRSASGETIGRLRDQLAKVRKLATIGARCSQGLPQLRLRIDGTVEALARQPDVLGVEVLEALAPLLDDLRRLASMCEVGAVELAPLSLFNVVRRASAEVKPLAAPHDIDLLVGVPAEIEVVGEQRRLHRALVELLRNATEHSPRGQAVEIGARSEGGRVELTIIDHGEGLPEGTLDRLFEPFLTTRQDIEAVGIGLYEARQHIAAMGGDVRLESSPGGGTVVHIVLNAP